MIYAMAFAVAALAYLLLGLVLFALGWRSTQARLFALACTVHALWAGSMILPASGEARLLSEYLFTAHYTAWIVFFCYLFPGRWRGAPAMVLLAAPLLLALKLALPLAAAAGPQALTRLALIADLGSIVLLLLMIVAAYQAAGESERWSLKFLAFPLGALTVYDLFLYTQGFAFPLVGQEFFLARGPLNLIAFPLLAIAAYRNKIWRLEVRVSRQVALYSIALMGLGLYLILVAGVALLLRRFPETDIVPLQIGLLFTAVLLFAFLVTSGTMRARLRLFLARHVYARKYDYAHEWRKFMQTLAVEAQSAPLENRIIRACADLLEVPGGALWLCSGGRAHLAAVWNYRAPEIDLAADDLACLWSRDGNPRCLHGRALADSVFAADPAAWLVVPLAHETTLVGLLVLSHPRVAQEFDDEDAELVLLVARQCASFLAEKTATSALEETRQFARFNRQYAFVAHDLKNIVSQLSMMMRNFDRHADNPEFRRDMIETVRHAVGRMEGLLDRMARLAAGESAPDTPELVRLDELIGTDAARRDGAAGGGAIAVHIDPEARGTTVRVAPERLSDILDHLLANAREAAGTEGHVSLRLSRSDRHAIIDIIDDGPGMSADFIRDRLFTPFRSTKAHGLGVGAYQCREFAREMGGDLEVISSPGSGTTMRLRLPLVDSNKGRGEGSG